ncbi:precorrin-6A reductase [Methanobrevibacter curvatus]|nr:precorrin-6A reductase [Methanobrevibacter curvatus]
MNKETNKNQRRILLMGGTSDSISILNMLKESFPDVFVLTTTTTDHGARIAKTIEIGEVVSRSTSDKTLTDYIKEYSINLILDASHPFAKNGRLSGIDASKNTKIDYIRYERPYLDINGLNLKHFENVFMVESFEEASIIISKNLPNNKVFHLGGVSTLNQTLKYLDPKDVLIRILPHNTSIQKATEMEINPKNIIAIEGKFSKNFNKALFKEYNINAIITKESGIAGGLKEKIEAADDLNIYIFLVKRPNIKELNGKLIINDLEDLKELIKKVKMRKE